MHEKKQNADKLNPTFALNFSSRAYVFCLHNLYVCAGILMIYFVLNLMFYFLGVLMQLLRFFVIAYARVTTFA